MFTKQNKKTNEIISSLHHPTMPACSCLISSQISCLRTNGKRGMPEAKTIKYD